MGSTRLDEQQDDERLYGQVLRGDESALVELVGRYHRPLYQFLARYTGDPTLAEDLTQEAFTRFLTYHGEAPRQFRAWAYTIARNLARDHYKAAHVRYEQSTDFDGEGDSIDADAADFTAANSRQEVIDALAKLSPEHREVVLLRFYHELKLEEIAEVTHAPLGTVKSRLFHALKLLKGFLALAEVAYERA